MERKVVSIGDNVYIKKRNLPKDYPNQKHLVSTLSNSMK